MYSVRYIIIWYRQVSDPIFSILFIYNCSPFVTVMGLNPGFEQFSPMTHWALISLHASAA